MPKENSFEGQLPTLDFAAFKKELFWIIEGKKYPSIAAAACSNNWKGFIGFTDSPSYAFKKLRKKHKEGCSKGHKLYELTFDISNKESQENPSLRAAQISETIIREIVTANT